MCLRVCLRVCVGVETEDFFFVCLRQTKEPPPFSTPTRDVTHIVAPLVFDYFLFLRLVTLVASKPDLSARFETVTVNVGSFDNNLPSGLLVGGVKRIPDVY